MWGEWRGLCSLLQKPTSCCWFMLFTYCCTWDVHVVSILLLLLLKCIGGWQTALTAPLWTGVAPSLPLMTLCSHGSQVDMVEILRTWFMNENWTSFLIKQQLFCNWTYFSSLLLIESTVPVWCGVNYVNAVQMNWLIHALGTDLIPWIKLSSSVSDGETQRNTVSSQLLSKIVWVRNVLSRPGNTGDWSKTTQSRWRSINLQSLKSEAKIKHNPFRSPWGNDREERIRRINEWNVWDQFCGIFTCQHAFWFIVCSSHITPGWWDPQSQHLTFNSFW